MKRMRVLIVFIVLLLCFPIFTFSDGIPEENSREENLERMVILCKLWGAVKHFHPYVLTKNIDWDQALIKTYPMVKNAGNTNEFRRALNHMLSFLNDPATLVPDNEKQSPAKPVKQTATPGESQPLLEWPAPKIALIKATDYSQLNMVEYKVSKKIFEDTFKKCLPAEYVIFDFRNLTGGSFWSFHRFLINSISYLINDDLVLPEKQTVSHFGYQNQHNVDYAFHSGIKLISPVVVRPMRASPGKDLAGDIKFVFLLNNKSVDCTDVIAALREKNQCLVVFEGDLEKGAFVTTTSLKLSKNISANIRLHEKIYRGRPIRFNPDVHVKENALDNALKILKSGSFTAKSSKATGTTSIPSSTPLHYEKSYPHMLYPTEEYRILSLFRYWSVIDNFFPYKDLMDQKWEKSLLEFIPEFIAAGNAREYVLAIARLGTRLQDSHVGITSTVWDEIIGLYRPPIRLDFVEGQTVVTKINDSLEKKSGVHTGDIVLSVDGEEAAKKRSSLARILPASTKGRLENKIDMHFLLGAKDSWCILKIKNAHGIVKKKRFKRTVKGMPERCLVRETPVSYVLPGGIGYVDLDRLTISEIDDSFKKIKNTPALILDMRGYPASGTFNFVLSYISKDGITIDWSRCKYFHSGGGYRAAGNMLVKEQNFGPIPTEKYKGKVTVLISRAAQSAAEHICLFLEHYPDLIFVGNPTSGANGNVTYAVLPGGILLRFTGLHIAHADGRELQRKGIQPHVLCKPTIADIRLNRDTILQKGIEVLKRKIAATPSEKK
ncbi:MAG: hypothetical protein GY757_35340 [bacterium]|nr:hypothetical protein [bacterium]